MIASLAVTGAAILILLAATWAICRSAWRDPSDLDRLLAGYSPSDVEDIARTVGMTDWEAQ